MKVTLSHCRNPDICGGYWQQPLDSGKRRTVEVASIAEASQVCRAYIDRNGLGSGNWSGGQVYDGKTHIACISYNGRAWSADDKTPL